MSGVSVHLTGGWRTVRLMVALATATLCQAETPLRAPPALGSGRCVALADGTVAASDMALSTGGATVASAEIVAGGAGRPFCKVLGSVAAADSGDPPIAFRLNLPVRWNGKAVQFGGGGFNGVVIDGLGRGPGQVATDPTPLTQGYATYGSDSGHSSAGFDGRFAMNAQALANYGGESVKRTRDVAAVLIRRFYGKPARRTYYVGGSKGGQEGLVAAQRYPADFDGVVSFFPAAQNQGQVMSWYRMWKAVYETRGAPLNGAKQRLLKAAVLKECDALDGVRDGLVANVVACRGTFAINRLRCPRGQDAGDGCLSDPQIDALQVAATPYRFPFPLANGVIQVGPYPVYEGADLAPLLYAPDGADGGAALYHAFFAQVWPYFDALDPSFGAKTFDPRDFQARAQQISALYDVTNTDLDAFRARGGKLIVVQGTTDMLVPESMTTAYVERLHDRYGAALHDFARYYVQPGYGHGQGDFTLTWDALAALDTWVERGRAPIDPVAVDANPATAGRSMPLCEHPRYPRYLGAGDPRNARSYTCALPE